MTESRFFCGDPWINGWPSHG